MEIGNKIQELRKQNNLSQEQLAEKLNVARQTISKWELGETSPDLSEAKKISKIFNVSLDDLTNNDIKNVLISKISNTEKLTKTIINILKIILLIIVIIVIIQVASICFKEYFDVKPVATGRSIECIIGDKSYSYEAWVKYDAPNIINSFSTNDKELNIDYTKYNSVDLLFEDVKENVISRGGSCDQQIK